MTTKTRIAWAYDLSQFEQLGCKPKCKERERKVDTLLLLVCVMKPFIFDRSCDHAMRVFVVVLTSVHVVNLTILISITKNLWAVF